MDKNNQIAYLTEILDELKPYGDLYVCRVRSNDEEWLPVSSLEPKGLIEACMGDPLRVDFTFHTNGAHFSIERVVPFEASRYFVKGQGKSFARSMKKEVANKLFDLGI